jgi:[acyl-carrier-protein] S-malonyltransferase
VAGHSVGEYSALYAAGVLTFKDTLNLVSLRGELMFKAGEKHPGTMFAIINLDDKKVEEICNELSNKGNGNIIVPANYNSPGQIVVSGSAQYLKDNISAFKKAGAKIVKELTVSGAFHSPLVAPAQKELEQAILSVQFKKPKVPFYTNVHAQPTIDVNVITQALIAQLTSPVKWTQTLISMKQHGINEYIEIGPNKVLQGLVKRTLENVLISGIDTVTDLTKYIE